MLENILHHVNFVYYTIFSLKAGIRETLRGLCVSQTHRPHVRCLHPRVSEEAQGHEQIAEHPPQRNRE